MREADRPVAGARRVKILVCQHVAFEPLGTLDPLLKSYNVRIRYVNFGREPNAQPRILEIAGGTLAHVAAMRCLSEIRANDRIVRIRAQVALSGAILRNFSTASR